MGLLNTKGAGYLLVLFCIVLNSFVRLAGANIVVIGKNVSLSFNDLEANFAPSVKGSGECGTLYLADPLTACTSLKNKAIEGQLSPFVLIIRGGCAFDDKVRNAQSAGFKAAIVYDNEDSGSLVSMAGTPAGIHIHAVFISKSAGETLKKYAGRTDIELWIIPTFENSAWSIMAISFISLLAMSAVLATCFFVRRHRVRRDQPRPLNVREFHGMSSQLVKAMPSLIFTSVLEDNCTSITCAICLEDYSVGEQLRILPCCHKFHSSCVDAWLTSWRTFCPVCKRDARMAMMNPPASESTPLFTPAAASSPILSSFRSSFHSSVAASPSAAIPIGSTAPHSLLTSRTHSISNIPRPPIPHRSYNNLTSIHPSRSTAELRNATSSYRSHASSLASAHSLGYPISSSFISRHGSNYNPSPSYASPGYLGRSSSRHSYLRHCESGTSLSAMESAHSLPGLP
ncbi:receptor homology region, transmembrane domain- and RING domain-containing protein 1-like [Phalaenopsis equestris]|uniref:receptor homology region, transmembrane domain- and RING domain-containing protein 1-like n=1 Tax=Phalaenopsis equestris TaxID=78828 RepID=UPI0009E603BE|nr:receptor homology region, transmembrane domain- and RING domain-containing protein 1-like [Phalaenopsis equestris]XP_020572722.1 receptor homology region, transmembrane domain- and RING domain-containing protein 1-like [Phalaenopsis equestris]